MIRQRLVLSNICSCVKSCSTSCVSSLPSPLLTVTDHCGFPLHQPEDVNSLLSIKLALKYAQLRDVESMRAVARAHQTRDLAAFEQTLRDYREELSSDPTIRSHLAALYDTLLEQNLLRIVEPYSVVEIEYVAQQVGQGRQDVEAKCVSLFH